MASTPGCAIEVLRRFTAGDAALSLGSVDRLGPIPVQLLQIGPGEKFITLLARCEEDELDEYFLGRRLALDAELGSHGRPTRCLPIEDVDCDWYASTPGTTEIRCHLPDREVLRPAGIRVPFVCGMDAEVMLHPFVGANPVSGTLLDLSLGGCRLQVPVQLATALELRRILPAVTIAFPNGQTFSCAAEIRHWRPLGSMAYLGIGLSFLDLDPHAIQVLHRILGEAGRDLAWRLGIRSRGSRPAELFERESVAVTGAGAALSQDPFLEGMRDICRRLYNIVICLRAERWFPVELLDSSVRDLMVLIESDRARCLYALGCLQWEPPWLRQAVEVATVLGEWLQGSSEERETVLEAVAGALLHPLGKPLLQGSALPVLSDGLTEPQCKLLNGHVAHLLARLRQVGWEPEPTTLDVMLNLNGGQNGSGYPEGRPDVRLSPMARKAAVVERARQLLCGDAGKQPLSPKKAWRWLFDRPEKFDRECVVRLAQRHGVYPIGSLVKFSRGFLAWVRDHDDRRMPVQVVVARNLAFPETTLKTVLRGVDLKQLGEPQRVVCPEDYGVAFPEFT